MINDQALTASAETGLFGVAKGVDVDRVIEGVTATDAALAETRRLLIDRAPTGAL
ncbi:hypothetical protein D3C87_2189730 [compost metagenome]